MLKFFLIILTTGVSIGLIYYNSVYVGIIITLSLTTTYPLYQKKSKQKEEYRLLLEFRDLLFLISSSFYLGRSMKQALEEAEKYYSTNIDKNNIMVNELKIMKNEMEISNCPDLEVLRRFALRQNLKDINDFVNVYENCKETGADLSKAIERTAAIIADRISIRNELKGILSEKILEGRIVLLSAPLMIMLIRIMSPSYMVVMNQSLKGLVLTTISLLLSALSLILIERINRVDL